jgi:hypothetical protein
MVAEKREHPSLATCVVASTRVSSPPK